MLEALGRFVPIYLVSGGRVQASVGRRGFMLPAPVIARRLSLVLP